MKKKLAVFAMILGLLLFGAAAAELSTNLLIVNTVDPRTKLTTLKTFTDAEGQPVIASDKGYASVRYTYGNKKQVTKEELLDAEGNLVNGNEGFAYRTSRYSIRNLTERCYYSADGQLVNGPEGYARQISKYSQGKHDETWQYDAAGNVVGTHRLSEYGMVGNVRRLLSDGWYDAENNPAPGPNGYARVEYDYAGKYTSRTAYFDENGEPYYYAKAGYAAMVSEYKYGQIQSTDYYGADGELIAGPK